MDTNLSTSIDSGINSIEASSIAISKLACACEECGDCKDGWLGMGTGPTAGMGVVEEPPPMGTGEEMGRGGDGAVANDRAGDGEGDGEGEGDGAGG